MRIKTILAFVALSFAPPVFAAETSGSLWYGFTDVATNLAAVALVMFLVIVWRFGGFRSANQALDDRATAIEAELEQARSLREAATDAFAKAQQRQEQADVEAQLILENAKTQADAMIEAARKSVDESLARKEAQLETRIARAEADAVADIKNRTIELAGQVSGLILTDNDTREQVNATLDSFRQS